LRRTVLLAHLSSSSVSNSAVDLLRGSPEQGRARPDLASGLRLVPFGRSVVVVYQVVGDAIEILRIFYGGQDYETIMSGEGEEDVGR